MNPVASRVGSYALFAVGGLIALAGIIWCANTAVFAAHAKKTEGEIVRFEKAPTKGGWAIHPVFSYHDSSGHRWEGTAGYGSAAFSVGQKVPVVYDPQAPISSSIDSLRGIWGGPLLILFWGLFFLIFAWRIAKKEKGLNLK